MRCCDPEPKLRQKALSSRSRTITRVPADLEIFVHDTEHLRLVVEAAPIAIVVADDDGLITLLNERGARIFGYEPGELLGRPVESLVPVRFRGGNTELRDKYLRDAMVRAIGEGRDLYGLRKDGSEIAIEIGLHPIATPQGSFTLAAIVDITERKDAEEMRQRDRALDASELKSQFVATMSHELRTPLNAIIGMAELLKNRGLNERQRTYVETIETSAEALLTVISSILDFSKIEAGRVDLEAQDFALDTLLTAAADVVAKKVQRKGLTLATYVDPVIPPVLRGDADRLRQILLNLIGNAVKFTERGHIDIRALLVETTTRRVTVRFEVQDTGIGVSSEILPTLFAPFVQGDSSTSRKYGGTGLGLSISKRLVELMQGEIGVTSEAAGGSLFWFTAQLATVGTGERLTEPGRQPEDNGPAAAASAEAAAASAAEAVAAAQAAALSASASEAAAALLSASAAEAAAVLISAAEAAAALLSASAADAAVVLLSASAAEAAALSASAAEAAAVLVSASAAEAAVLSASAAEAAAALVSASAAEAAAVLESAAEAAASSQGRAVLIAEDNADLQTVLVHQFAELAVPMTIVSDGAEAVAAVRRKRFALIFMDCQMPNLDGFAATRAIRDDERSTGAHVPIVAVTANAFKEDRQLCLDAGMDDYLSKPVRINDFRTMIQRWAAPVGADI
jgi:PAS domain S-box-containing protein